MPKLRCSAVNCKFNDENLCSRSRIHIQGSEAIIEEETQCGTFKYNEGEKIKLFQTEFAKLDGANEQLSINCDCYRCRWNQNDLCSKELVKVSGYLALNRTQTVCESFSKRP